MSNIEKAQKAVEDFLKKTLKVKDVKLVKTVRSGEGWNCEAEIYEESSFIKALGLPTRVQDRNYYFVKLNANLEVDAYGRKDKEEPEEK